MAVAPERPRPVLRRAGNDVFFRPEGRRQDAFQQGRRDRYRADEGIADSQGQGNARALQEGVTGDGQDAESHEGGGKGKKDGKADQSQRRMMLVEVTLVGAHQIEGIIGAHADDHHGNHDGGNAQRLPQQIQGSQGADQREEGRQETEQRQLPVQQVQEGHGDSHGPHNEGHFDKTGKQPIGQPLCEECRIKERPRPR